jgi:hypothetical protein
MNESDSSERRALQVPRVWDWWPGSGDSLWLAAAKAGSGLFLFRSVYDQTSGAQASDSTNTFIYGKVQPIPSVGPLLFDNNGAEEEMLKAQVCS